MKNVLAILCLAMMIPSGILAQPDYFKAVNDTVDLYPGVTRHINLMDNDIFAPTDSIQCASVGLPLPLSMFVKRNFQPDGNAGFFLSPGITGSFEAVYSIKRKGTADTSSAILLYRVFDNSFDSLVVNQVHARISATNINFSDYTFSKSVAPKSSDHKTIFQSSLWVGGNTADSVIHMAASEYGAVLNTAKMNNDFWAGPVMDSSAYSENMDSLWSFVWNLKKSEIEYHKSHYQTAGYIPIHDILTWPGNGDTSKGQAKNLAPYVDMNHDGKYNPSYGDYPVIRGDQALFYIFNDDRGRSHSASAGKQVRVEIHAMAYAYQLPWDSAFNHTIFINYKLFNRSENTYFNSNAGIWTDIDIGDPYDDYMGCDVGRSCYYGYNGKTVDGNSYPGSLGTNPPAQAVTVLAGPYIEKDGLDNPKTDLYGNPLCNESINGFGFSDSILDNERSGLSGFICTTHFIPGIPFPLPFTDDSTFNNYLDCRRYNGTPLKYYDYLYGGMPCRFYCQGLSDPLHWNVGCKTPNAPEDWTELKVGINPGERVGLGIMGPFTFKPEEVQEIDIAYTWARDYSDTLNRSVPLLLQYVDSIRAAYFSNILPGGGSFNGVNNPPKSETETIRIYPNPASGQVTIDFQRMLTEVITIRVTRLNGQEVMSETRNVTGNKLMLSTSGFSNGLYLLTIRAKDFSSTLKLTIIR